MRLSMIVRVDRQEAVCKIKINAATARLLTFVKPAETLACD